MARSQENRKKIKELVEMWRGLAELAVTFPIAMLKDLWKPTKGNNKHQLPVWKKVLGSAILLVIIPITAIAGALMYIGLGLSFPFMYGGAALRDLTTKEKKVLAENKKEKAKMTAPPVDEAGSKKADAPAVDETNTKQADAPAVDETNTKQADAPAVDETNTKQADAPAVDKTGSKQANPLANTEASFKLYEDTEDKKDSFDYDDCGFSLHRSTFEYTGDFTWPTDPKVPAAEPAGLPKASAAEPADSAKAPAAEPAGLPKASAAEPADSAKASAAEPAALRKAPAAKKEKNHSMIRRAAGAIVGMAITPFYRRLRGQGNPNRAPSRTATGNAFFTTPRAQQRLPVDDAPSQASTMNPNT